MKIRFTYLFFSFWLVTLTFGSYAQQDCANSLFEAKKLFDAGNVQESVDRLVPCITSLHDKSKKAEAYRFLAIAHQELHQDSISEVYVLKLLQANHSYHNYPGIDPTVFTRLVNSYSVKPKVYLGLDVGISLNQANMQKSYSAYSSTQRYESIFGYALGVNADVVFKNNLIGTIGIFTLAQGYKHILDSAAGWSQEYTEDQRLYGVKAEVGRRFSVFGKWSILPQVGIGFGYLHETNVYFDVINQETGSKQQTTQNPIENRYRWNPFVAGGLRVNYDVGLAKIGLSVKYNQFINNTFDPNDRMADPDFNIANQYVNDDVRMRNWLFQLNATIPVIFSIKKEG